MLSWPTGRTVWRPAYTPPSSCLVATCSAPLLRVLPSRNGPALTIPAGANIEKPLAAASLQGLGEMMPEQLWATTLDPARRTLRRLTVEVRFTRASAGMRHVLTCFRALRARRTLRCLTVERCAPPRVHFVRISMPAEPSAIQWSQRRPTPCISTCAGCCGGEQRVHAADGGQGGAPPRFHRGARPWLLPRGAGHLKGACWRVASRIGTKSHPACTAAPRLLVASHRLLDQLASAYWTVLYFARMRLQDTF